MCAAPRAPPPESTRPIRGCGPPACAISARVPRLLWAHARLAAAHHKKAATPRNIQDRSQTTPDTLTCQEYQHGRGGTPLREPAKHWPRAATMSDNRDMDKLDATEGSNIPELSKF